MKWRIMLQHYFLHQSIFSSKEFIVHLAVCVEEVASALHLVAAAGYPLDGAAHPKLEAVRAPPSAHSGVRRA